MIQYIRSESDLTRGKFQVPIPKAFENGIWNLAVSLARRFNVTDETGETDETGKFQTTKPHPISTPKFQVPTLGSAGIWSAMATSRGRSCGLEFRGSRINFHISSQERVKFSALKFQTEGFRGTWNHDSSTGTTGGTSKPQFPPLGCSGTFHYRPKIRCSRGASSTWNLGLSIIVRLIHSLTVTPVSSTTQAPQPGTRTPPRTGHAC